MKAPCDDFVRFILTRIEYPGVKTKQKIEQFTPLVQQAFTQFVKDLIDARLKSALERDNEPTEEASVEETTTEHRVDVEYPLHLFLDSKSMQASARYEDSSSFVVLAGSQAVKEESPHLPERYADLRAVLIGNGVLVDEGNTYRLTQDRTFRSSSAAAGVLLAASRNGFTTWKNADGRLLRDILKS